MNQLPGGVVEWDGKQQTAERKATNSPQRQEKPLHGGMIILASRIALRGFLFFPAPFRAFHSLRAAGGEHTRGARTDAGRKSRMG